MTLKPLRDNVLLKGVEEEKTSGGLILATTSKEKPVISTVVAVGPGTEDEPMCKDRKRVKAYVSAAANPGVIETMRTYCWASNTEVIVVPAKDGKTDKEALKKMLGADAACFYLQQPNYYGLMEDAGEIGEIVHGAGAKFVMASRAIPPTTIWRRRCGGWAAW